MPLEKITIVVDVGQNFKTFQYYKNDSSYQSFNNLFFRQGDIVKVVTNCYNKIENMREIVKKEKEHEKISFIRGRLWKYACIITLINKRFTRRCGYYVN